MARTRQRKTVAAPYEVAVLVTPDTSPFELGVVTAVFGSYLRDMVPRRYEVKVCAEHPGPMPLADGMTLTAPYGLRELAAAHTVIVSSVDDADLTPSDAVLDALREAHRRGARMVSTCTGAFTLAAAGLLDGRRATTYWRSTEALRSRFPLIDVDPDPLYVDEGDVLTSAGAAAGLDLCLHLVRKDCGAELANAIARRLVVPPHRDGGQAQYVEAPITASTEDNGIARSMDWALRHLTDPLTVAALARQARMSERTYLRNFARTTGSSPIRWLITQRVRASLPLLETTDAPIEELATTVGFDSVVTYRHHFHRVMQTSPSHYRRTFRTGQTRDS